MEQKWKGENWWKNGENWWKKWWKSETEVERVHGLVKNGHCQMTNDSSKINYAFFLWSLGKIGETFTCVWTIKCQNT